MDEFLLADKVLLLCEDHEAASWMAQLLPEVSGEEWDFSAGTGESDAAGTLDAVDTVLIFASTLGEKISVCIDTLRATYPGVRVLLFTREGSLELARRSLGLGVDEYITSRCSPRRVRAVLQEALGVKEA